MRPLAIVGGLFFSLLACAPAQAIPLFAHEYDVTCQKCHTVIPQLNSFGTFFLANGYRIPGVEPGPAFPFATRFNFVASSANQGSGPNGEGLPKAIVDEIELFTAGLIGNRANYFVEQYVVDGGEHGSLRDAWLKVRLDPWTARVPVSLEVGQFTLPVPVDPETFRPTYQHYTLYDQTVGDNPFNFFDDKDGALLGIGSEVRGASVQLFAGPGHDVNTDVATVGVDTMAYAQQIFGPFTLAAYRYQGTRPVGTSSDDRFERTGYSLLFGEGNWSAQSVLQTGWDSSCLPNVGCPSSGGLLQLQYSVSPRFFFVGRYEGTNDTLGGFSRDAVLLAGYRPTHNSRLSIEDVVQRGTNTVNLQLTTAY